MVGDLLGAVQFGIGILGLLTRSHLQPHDALVVSLQIRTVPPPEYGVIHCSGDPSGRIKVVRMHMVHAGSNAVARSSARLLHHTHRGVVEPVGMSAVGPVLAPRRLSPLYR
jgi:hypothetical protein